MHDDRIPRRHRGAWTVMAYLAGRNDVHPHLERQADALMATRDVPAKRFDDATIATSVLLAGPPGSTGATLAVVGSRPTTRTLDSGDWRTLARFVRWSVHRRPAEHYALVIGGHGDGWSVGPRPSALAADDRFGSSITTRGLRHALAESRRLIGRRLDVLVLDACLMANVETLIEVRDQVDVVVASAARTPDRGAPHETVLRWLPSRSSVNADEIARAWVAQFPVAGPGDGAATGATAVHTAGLGVLVPAVDEWGAAMAAGVAGGDGAAIEAARLDAFRHAPELTDIGSLAAAIGRADLCSAAAPAIRSAAAMVGELVRPDGPLVLARTDASRAGEHVAGLSIALPRRGPSRGYDPMRLQAARITGWRRFLESLRTIAPADRRR